MTLTSSLVYDAGGDCVSLIFLSVFHDVFIMCFSVIGCRFLGRTQYSMIKSTGKVGQSFNAEKPLVLAGFMRYRFARAICRSE